MLSQETNDPIRHRQAPNCLQKMSNFKYIIGRMRSGEQRHWRRMAVLTAAVAAMLFLATVGSEWHFDAPGSEATCPICHFAHMPVLPGVSTNIPVAPAMVVWVLPAETYGVYAAPVGLDSPPRAPPA